MESEPKFFGDKERMARYMELVLLGLNMEHVYSIDETEEMRQIERELALSKREIIDQGKDIVLE